MASPEFQEQLARLSSAACALGAETERTAAPRQGTSPCDRVDHGTGRSSGALREQLSPERLATSSTCGESPLMTEVTAFDGEASCRRAGSAGHPRSPPSWRGPVAIGHVVRHGAVPES
jgi:hypothetical protein